MPSAKTEKLPVIGRADAGPATGRPATQSTTQIFGIGIGIGRARPRDKIPNIRQPAFLQSGNSGEDQLATRLTFETGLDEPSARTAYEIILSKT
jgi:hypothetical protein